MSTIIFSSRAYAILPFGPFLKRRGAKHIDPLLPQDDGVFVEEGFTLLAYEWLSM